MKIFKVIKQLKHVEELLDENLELYNEKQYLQVELELKTDEYKKTLNQIKDIVNENPNGSATNLQNRIRALLEEVKI